MVPTIQSRRQSRKILTALHIFIFSFLRLSHCYPCQFVLMVKLLVQKANFVCDLTKSGVVDFALVWQIDLRSFVLKIDLSSDVDCAGARLCQGLVST